MTAIVTCGETRSSLAAVRALGRASVPVAVGAKKRPSLAMWSRYAGSTFLTEDPTTNAQLFAQKLGIELKARYAVCALVSTDEALWAISRFREYLPSQARRILPPHFSVARSLDHEALHHFAESLGIACGSFVRIPKDAPKRDILKAVKEAVFPALIRPIISWTDREDGPRQAKRSVVARSHQHFVHLLEEIDWFTDGLLISAYKTLKALSYFGVADKGEVLVDGFQERLSELEPHSEIATVAITVSPVPSIREAARVLIQALQWQGPFKIEFAKDKKGDYRLISLIGRLWGSLQLAISANVNIPLICYRLADNSLTEDMLHRPKRNVRLRWLLGDITKMMNPRHLLNNWSWPKLSPLSLLKKGTDRPGKTIFDVIDWDDPMPFVFELQSKTWHKLFKT